MEAGTEPGMRRRSEIDWHHCSDLDVDLNRDCDSKPPISCYSGTLSPQCYLLCTLLTTALDKSKRLFFPFLSSHLIAMVFTSAPPMSFSIMNPPPPVPVRLLYNVRVSAVNGVSDT